MIELGCTARCATASVVLHSVKHSRKPLDFPSRLGANRIDTSDIERICNDALAAKTRFYVPKSVQHHARTRGLEYIDRRAAGRPTFPDRRSVGSGGWLWVLALSGAD